MESIIETCKEILRLDDVLSRMAGNSERKEIEEVFNMRKQKFDESRQLMSEIDLEVRKLLS